MNKLEVGMYCRYKRGSINGYVPSRIGKIIERLNDSEFLKLDTNCTILENDIIGEPSFNPIDLIEVGDYVNGYYVSKIWKSGEITHYVDEKPIQRKEKQITIQAPSYGGIIHLHNEDIKSIVTKEQFSSMEYRLGDK